MPNSMEFFFDFSSSYRHIAREKINNLTAEYKCLGLWLPFFLRIAFKVTSEAPFPSFPIKGQYAEPVRSLGY